jgi:hypothetical protein
LEPVLKELEVLLEYLVKHNQEHAKEITELAARAQALGKTAAYEHLKRGVDLMNDSSKSLQAALAALEG